MTEIVLGFIGPFIVAAATCVLAYRTFKRDPERLTGLMLKAFGAKVVFFGVYVVGSVSLLSLRPVPFVMSFTVTFIVLHVTEALYLRRLFEPQNAR